MCKRPFFLLIVTGVFLLSSLCFAKMLETKKPILPTAKDRQEKIRNRVKELDKQLDLTEEQEKKLTEILTKSKQEINKVMEGAGEKIAALREQAETDVQVVLTQAQKEKYQKVPEEEEGDGFGVIKSKY